MTTGGSDLAPTRKRRPCFVVDCTGAHYARGYCRRHYLRMRRGKNPHSAIPTPRVATPCLANDCGRAVDAKGAKGLCTRHYQQLRKCGSPSGTAKRPAVDRFFAKVRQAGDCWEWTASRDKHGYGMFSGRPGGASIRSHIWAFEYFVDAVPNGLQLDHLCHTFAVEAGDCDGGLSCVHRRCVNPWHLDPVPAAVNTERGVRVARPAVACPAGHFYDELTTYINPLGRKVCRICSAAARARYENRKRAA